MTLGQIKKCWVCGDDKHICKPFKSGKQTIAGGAIAWLCGDCYKRVAQI